MLRTLSGEKVHAAFGRTNASVLRGMKHLQESVSSSYLPRGRVSPEIGKLSCKPVVDLVESQLSVWRLQNGLRAANRSLEG